MPDGNSLELGSLAFRLELVERRLRRLRIVAMLGFILAAITAARTLVPRESAVQEGRLWIAHDSAGRTRMMFGITGDGVGLTMYDSTGQMRLDLGIAPGNVPGLLMLSRRGEPVATLNLASDGSPTLRLTNPQVPSRVDLTAAPGRPPLTMQPPTLPDTVIARRPQP
ncbi:MAG: hypothetical protein ABI647_10750 [Gemmatimonadota bacterium]